MCVFLSVVSDFFFRFSQKRNFFSRISRLYMNVFARLYPGILTIHSNAGFRVFKNFKIFLKKKRERVEKMEVESGASRGRRVNELETHLLCTRHHLISPCRWRSLRILRSVFFFSNE